MPFAGEHVEVDGRVDRLEGLRGGGVAGVSGRDVHVVFAAATGERDVGLLAGFAASQHGVGGVDGQTLAASMVEA